MEFFVFLLFLFALLGTLFVSETASIDPSLGAMQAGRESLQTQFGFLTSVFVVGIYVLHLVIGSPEAGRISMPLVHFISPFLLAGIGYYRLLQLPENTTEALGVTGSPLQIAALFASVLVISMILMRLSCARYMHNHRDIKWEITLPALIDGSFFRLMLQMRPLLYPPRRYRICPEGLLIEGWNYVKPVRFDDVASVKRIMGTSMLNTGHYYAGSVKELIRIDLRDSNKGLYISPLDAVSFVKYCATYVTPRRASGPASSTRHGISAAGRTHAGDQPLHDRGNHG